MFLVFFQFKMAFYNQYDQNTYQPLIKESLRLRNFEGIIITLNHVEL